MYIVYILHNF